ncbi:sodium:solute symporter family transporter [Nocardiopsis ansamitocini]|uniref:Cation acetate symporter n=1 Tax=Nocardiopsis ansamitocini TaxID=1670832 RepID=A0A9W6P2U1_9ACTN|nr:hypothetical protein [Nocardiopsis ansamitocini]GLU46057.1 cation acetate symporter [Nocardiopsis ansamitocini]
MTELAGGLLFVGCVMVMTLITTGLLNRRRTAAGAGFVLATAPPGSLLFASAAAGEHLSAVLLLGVAGLLLAQGLQALGSLSAVALGCVLLAVLVVTPLRRAGVYSYSDFAEWRLGSRVVRRMTSASAVIVGWCFLLAQYIAAGLLLRAFTSLPEWTAWSATAIVTLVLTLSSSGVSSTRFQAVHFWFKLAALALPALALLVAWQMQGAPRAPVTDDPVFRVDTEMEIDRRQAVGVTEPTPVTVLVSVQGETVATRSVLEPGVHAFVPGTVLLFETGTTIPHHVDPTPAEETGWHGPGPGPGSLSGYLPYLSVALGVIGLLQFPTRFYGTPSPRAARRLVALVAALVVVFTLVPLVYAMLARIYVGELLVNGQVDLAVLQLPERMLPGRSGVLMTVLIAAGVASAVVTVSVGLAAALSGTISQCVLGGGSTAYRWGALLAAGTPLLIVTAWPELAGADLASIAFAGLRLSAVTIAPLLLIGIWWRGLTDVGAAAGLVVGLVGSAVEALSANDVPVGVPLPGALQGPAGFFLVLLVPGVMIGVSLITRQRVPGDVLAMLARLHLPEQEAGRWR